MKKMDVEAKKSMLQKLKSDMREMMHGDLPEKLQGKVKKVVVESDSPEGLDKGLSMAQKILKGKLSQDIESEDEHEETEEEDEYDCGGKEKYMDGGVEEEVSQEQVPKEEESSGLKKYWRGFQGTKPFESKTPAKPTENQDKIMKSMRKSFN